MKLQLCVTQRRAFRRDGFLLVENVAGPEEVAELRAILGRLFARKAGLDEGHLIDLVAPALDSDLDKARSPQLRWPLDHAPELARTRFHANAHEMARQLLGRDAIFAFDHAIIKPAHDGAETPWHQDIAFQDAWDVHRELTFWMPLQDVGPDNSCLKYLPGSHRGRLERHRPLRGDARIHVLEARGITDEGAVPAILPAGGVVVHDCRTLHGAGPNRSNVARWSYAVAYRRPGRDWLHRHRFGPHLRDPLAGFLPSAARG